MYEQIQSINLQIRPIRHFSAAQYGGLTIVKQNSELSQGKRKAYRNRIILTSSELVNLIKSIQSHNYTSRIQMGPNSSIEVMRHPCTTKVRAFNKSLILALLASLETTYPTPSYQRSQYKTNEILAKDRLAPKIDG